MVWAPGHKLQNGKYVIGEILGQGGFGITYKARNTQINESVVIKTPNTQTSTGNVGNRGFAPYEQLIRGSRKPNVDIYCLAATFYFILTGQSPTFSLDRKLNNARLIPPKYLISTISKEINKAILKGVELEPNKRPKSMKTWLKR